MQCVPLGVAQHVATWLTFTLVLQIDFKLVGDATDLQAAAARMRYTRLRKAVEAGHFKGATLAHPAVVSASMVQLANPQARRFGTHPQQSLTDSVDDVPGATMYTGATRPINLDEEEEDEDEELEELEESESLVDQSRGRTCRAVNVAEVEADADNRLFYPDTSRSSRALKRIKRSDSDDNEEEEKEYTPSKFKRNTGTLTRQPRTTNTAATPPPPRAHLQQGLQQSVSTNRIGTQQQSTLQLGILRRPGFVNEQNANNDRQSVEISRKKKSANDAAKAAYDMGIANGRWPPHPGDNNVSSDHTIHSYSVNQTPNLRYIGHGLHSVASQSIWNNANADVNVSGRNAPNLQAHANVPLYTPRNLYLVGSSSFHQAPPSPFATRTVPPPVGHQQSQYRSYEPDSLPQAEDYPPPRRYNPSDPNRFHPASVFDGFEMPTVAPPPSKGTGPDIKRVGEPSLLQKVVMNKQKEAEGKAASHEKKDMASSVAVDNSQQVKSGGKVTQTATKTGATDEPGEDITGSTQSNTKAPPAQARVHGSNSLRSDRPYPMTRTDVRASTAITHPIATREELAAGIGAQNDTVKKGNASQETVAGNPPPEAN